MVNECIDEELDGMAADFAFQMKFKVLHNLDSSSNTTEMIMVGGSLVLRHLDLLTNAVVLIADRCI